MCGIVGIVGEIGRVSARDALCAAANALRHRGPDADGFFQDDRCAFGHRRLSIIDTADRANQPMFAPDRSAVIVYNGEIYNYRELRDDLVRRGEKFTTASDTEVLLRLILRDGTEALNKLSGMFAFAVWRPAERELLLARDRFGEKPMHYAETRSRFVFASEIPVLLRLAEVPSRMDYEALGYYLETGFVPAPLTMFAGIRSLPPAHWLRWRDGVVTTGRYFEPKVNPDPSLADPRAASEAVYGALSRAVRRQMVSDVPLGAFLSGGIDSSSVVALLQQHASAPVKTFNVRFEQAEYDESAVARRVAAHLGTDHHELTVTDASFAEDDLWRIIDHVGVPFHDSSAIPTFVVSRYARQHVTVALSGDGGDEMFAGYPVFQWGQTVDRLARAPSSVLSVGAALAGAVGGMPLLENWGLLRQARKAMDLATIEDRDLRFRAIHRLFSPGEVAELLAPGLAGATTQRASERLAQLPSAAEAWSPLRRMMHMRLQQELPNDMLIKVDRMSMAASLEVRAPFLDPEVADVSGRLPDELLIQGGVGKYVLRQAMRRHLPDEVFAHPKRGFSIPLHRFVRSSGTPPCNGSSAGA
jgi:asparagine synthase (glutamine-hydrolysing)